MTMVNEIDGYMGRMPYISTTWRRCGVWLRTESAPRFVEADVIGACAVHEVMTSNGYLDYYGITHIPTGLQIRGYGDKRNADHVAEALASVARELNTSSAGKARKVIAGVIGD